MEEHTKTCTKCDLTKALNDFNRSSRSKDGHRRSCRACDAAYNRERYVRDPEKMRAATKAWHEANPDKAKATHQEGCRRWRAKNPDAGADYMRERRSADPEGMRDANRRWYAQNPQKYRESARNWSRANKPWQSPQQRASRQQWRRANRESCAESLRRYRARKKASIVVRFTLDQLAERMSIFAGCWMCGGDWTEIDHVKPVSKGGPHCLSNIRPACRSCNASKSDIWLGARETIRRFRVMPLVAVPITA